jgi:uncharacterized membrane protein
MNAEAVRALDRRIAVILRVGTWLASAVIAIGLVLPSGAPVVTTGIALFVALPIVRVTVMLVEFLRHRDYPIGVISALVLTVIVLGIALSVRTKATGG